MAKVTYVDMSQTQYKIENRGHNGTLIGKGTCYMLCLRINKKLSHHR